MGFLREELWTAVDGVAHPGQGELRRFEVTRTSSSSGVSLMDVISSPSGSGSSGVVGIHLPSSQ
jgi:hypothetical protein